MEMAAVLGSDVPFFLVGGLAFVSGRGERIKPIKIEDNEEETAETSFFQRLWVVLAKPPFSSDTATAYRLLDQTRENQPSLSTPQPPTTNLLSLITCLEKDPGTWPFTNDFLPVFLDIEREKSSAYLAILENLRKAGASFVSLSGAGSCCFGIFTAKEAAENAEKSLTVRGNFARLTFFLANSANPVLK